MIQDTIAKIEAQIRNSSSLTPERREELNQLLATLKAEVNDLAKTNQEDAQSIAGFTQVSAHEAMRAEQNPALLQHSLDGLTASAAQFEKSHPRLYQVVQSITNTLSNLGI
jgi:septal ring factor EnvC (AmiA/AmiB activator)